MLVPDLVDDLARRDRRRRDDRKKAEAAIGIDGRAGLIEAPAVVAREPAGKIQRCVGLEIMLLDAPSQLSSGGSPDGLVRPEIDFQWRLLQRRLPIIVHE
jgi:hypothetical protein